MGLFGADEIVLAPGNEVRQWQEESPIGAGHSFSKKQDIWEHQDKRAWKQWCFSWWYVLEDIYNFFFFRNLSYARVCWGRCDKVQCTVIYKFKQDTDVWNNQPIFASAHCSLSLEDKSMFCFQKGNIYADILIVHIQYIQMSFIFL